MLIILLLCHKGMTLRAADIYCQNVITLYKGNRLIWVAIFDSIQHKYHVFTVYSLKFAITL